MIIRICHKEASASDTRLVACISERCDLVYVPIADNHKDNN